MQTEQGEVGWANVWKTQGGGGGAVPSITDTVYILWVTKYFRMFNC